MEKIKKLLDFIKNLFVPKNKILPINQPVNKEVEPIKIPAPEIIPKKIIEPAPPVPPETQQDALLRVAKASLGKDISPRDLAPDDLGCAESLANVIHAVDPKFPIEIISTIKLNDELRRSKSFNGTLDLEPGNIIINVTGTGNGKIPGHCGIILEDGKIASNNSLSGKWDKHFTITTWVDRYKKFGGMPTRIYRKVS